MRNYTPQIAACVAAVYLVLFMALVFALHAHGHTFADFSTGSSGDAWEYAQLGNSMLHGGFSLDGIHPEFFRTPGYPFLIAITDAFGNSLALLILLQIALVALSAALVATIGERLFSRRVGLVAAILFALDPTRMILAYQTMTETLFVFILLLMIYLMLREEQRWQNALGVGLLGGFLTLTRPVGLFVLPALLLWYLARTRSWRPLAIAIAGALLLVAPWAARNEALAGHFSLSSIGAYNLLFYNIVEYDVARGEGTAASLNAKFCAEVGTACGDSRLRSFAYTNRITAIAKSELEPHFLSYVVFHVEKTIPFYIGSSIETTLRYLENGGATANPMRSVPNISALALKGQWGAVEEDLAANPFGLLERIFWLAVLILDAAALLLTREKERLAVAFLVLVSLAFGLLTGPISYPRYRLPAAPFMLLAAAQGLFLTIKRFRS